ncbi:MAG: D-2-hydroxyacid dehydrogenase [Aestuariivirgaceae bacterium]
MKLLVQGAAEASDVPGLDAAAQGLDVVFAPGGDALAAHLPGTRILLGWDFRGKELADSWHRADSLDWIHWCGAGVDAVLFPELVQSDVILTNSRGLFDRAMAEYVLCYMLSEAKLLRQSFELQSRREWKNRFTTKLAGQRALVFGVGSIGREIARLLQAVGVSVAGVGRSARPGDDCFDAIYAGDDVLDKVSKADWLIGVMPATKQTDRYFGKQFFAAMHQGARFINLGRGQAVDEAALLAVLGDNTIAGAMLDVFDNEPLPPENPLWQAPNLFVSAHMSGDYEGYFVDIAQMFFDNLARYQGRQPLHNVVDKNLGFVPSS